MTDFAAIRSRAEATGRRGWTVFVHHARTDVLILLDAVEERDRTIETLTAALHEIEEGALEPSIQGMARAALASVPQHDQGVTDD